jgi:hypothetical protein
LGHSRNGERLACARRRAWSDDRPPHSAMYMLLTAEARRPSLNIERT